MVISESPVGATLLMRSRHPLDQLGHMPEVGSKASPSIDSLLDDLCPARATPVVAAFSLRKPRLLNSRYALGSGRPRVFDNCIEVDGCDTHNCNQPVTVTFYPHDDAFKSMQAQYNHLLYRNLLRPLLAFVDPASTKGEAAACSRVPAAAAGGRLPGFFVTQQHSSVLQWAGQRGVRATPAMAAQQLEGFVRALNQLHKMGYVHGALHSHSVVFCCEDGGWAFRDLGSATRAGSEQALCCLPKHMPPESASAADSGARRAPASAAADMWAVGIIAYELLTRQPAFPGAYPCSFSSSRHACAHSTRCAPPAAQQQRTRDQLLGRAPLPWERGAPGAAARLACMGDFGDGVLACLSRDPQRRISAEQLLGRWHRVCLARFRRR